MRKIDPNFDILGNYFFFPLKFIWDDPVEIKSINSYRQFIYSKVETFANHEKQRNNRTKILNNINNLIAIHNYMIVALSESASDKIDIFFELFREHLKLRNFAQDFDLEDSNKYEISVIIKTAENANCKEETVLKTTLPFPLDNKFLEMLNAEFHANKKSNKKIRTIPMGWTFRRNFILKEFLLFIQAEIAIVYKKDAYVFMVIFFELTNLYKIIGGLTPETIAKAIQTLE